MMLWETTEKDLEIHLEIAALEFLGILLHLSASV